MKKALLSLMGAGAIAVGSQAQVTDFPYHQSFDDMNECAKVCWADCDLSEGWENDSTGFMDWIVNDGRTPTVGTGPVTDADGRLSGNYLYMESSGVCQFNRARLYSPTFDFAGMACPIFEFSYHMEGLTMGRLTLAYEDVSMPGTWHDIDVKVGPQGFFWNTERVHLPMLSGMEVRFRFTGLVGLGTFSDIAIDNISVMDDAIAPFLIRCPRSRVISTDAGVCEGTAYWNAPIGFDNCRIETLEGTDTSGTAFPAGENTVTYTATDAAGNMATCSFTVAVVDNELPVIMTGGDDVTVDSDPSACGATVTMLTPTAEDNCGVASILNDFNNTNNASGFYPVGTTWVTWTVTDVNDNVAHHRVAVTVVDNVLPTIACPADVSVNVDAGECSAQVMNMVATANDLNCDIASLWNDRNGMEDASGEFHIGTTVVKWTAVDNGGNEVSCETTVEVIDNIAPVIDNCPSDITTCDHRVRWRIPSASDNCGGSMTATHHPGNRFPDGETMVSYTATDASGNMTECSFTVTVREEPSIEVVDKVASSFWFTRDAAIDINVVGGAAPFNYLWSNGRTTEDLTNVFYGFHRVRVSDDFGCTAYRTIFVPYGFWWNGFGDEDIYGDRDENGKAVISIEEGINVFPNPSNGMVNVDIAMTGDVTVEVYNIMGGAMVHAWNGSVEGAMTHSFDLSNQAAGQYMVRVMAGNEVYNQKVVLTK